MRVSNVAARNHRQEVGTAAPVYYGMLAHGFPCTVAALPGAGGSMTIATSTRPGAESNPSDATWVDWPAGAVTSAEQALLASPVCAIRVTATTAAGAFEVVG